MVREVGGDGCGLIGRLGEAIAESTTGVDDGLAGFLGCGDASARDDLRRAHRGDVRATQILELAFGVNRKRPIYSALYVPSSWKGRVEGAGATIVIGTPSALGLGAALGAVSGNAVVARRVQDGDTLHTELHISIEHERQPWNLLKVAED